MACIYGKGSKYFLAEWSEEYEEVVVGREIKLSSKEKRERRTIEHTHPHVIISADNEKEANTFASTLTSIIICR